MPERVRSHMLLDVRHLDVLAKNLPRTHARQRRASRVEEERALPSAALELRPELALVHGHSRDRAAADRHQSLLAPLAEHAHEPFVEQRVLDPERDPLGHAQSGAIRELEQCAIAKGERLVEGRCREKALDVRHREHVGEGEPALGGLQPFSGILRHLPLPEQEPVVRAHCGDIAPNGRRREPHILEMVDVRAQHGGCDRRRRGGALHARVGRETREVAMVGLAGSPRRALLHREKVVESLEQEIAGDLVDRGHDATGTTVATAMHATPSPRPIHPMPSFVLPFTLTEARSRFTAAASASRIASRYGAIRGTSAITVTSTLLARHPRSRRCETARASISSESRILFPGSLSGNIDPISPSPAAPSRASVTASATPPPSQPPVSARCWGLVMPPRRTAFPAPKRWEPSPTPTRI